jgi:hypothetical protein
MKRFRSAPFGTHRYAIAARHPPDRCHGAGNEEAPDIALTHFRCTAELLPAAGGVLARHQAEPCREVSSATELLHRRREGLDGERGDRPTPGIVCRRRGVSVAFDISAILGRQCGDPIGQVRDLPEEQAADRAREVRKPASGPSTTSARRET